MAILEFGKHKGKQVRDVPISYLHWLLKQPDIFEGTLLSASARQEIFEIFGPRETDNAEIVWLRNKMKPQDALEAKLLKLEIERDSLKNEVEFLNDAYKALKNVHDKCSVKSGASASSRLEISFDEELLSRWRKALSKQFHPDRVGGNGEGMKAVNHGYDLLVQYLKEQSGQSYGRRQRW